MHVHLIKSLIDWLLISIAGIPGNSHKCSQFSANSKIALNYTNKALPVPGWSRTMEECWGERSWEGEKGAVMGAGRPPGEHWRAMRGMWRRWRDWGNSELGRRDRRDGKAGEWHGRKGWKGRERAWIGPSRQVAAKNWLQPNNSRIIANIFLVNALCYRMQWPIKLISGRSFTGLFFTEV